MAHRLCIWLTTLAVLSPSMGVCAGTVKRDVQGLATWGNAGVLTVGMGVAGIAHRWDSDLVGQLEGNPLFEVTTDPTNLYGSSAFNLPATFGLWLFSRASGNRKLEAVSCDLLRALGNSLLAVGPIKHGVRRSRPDGSNRLSFPSGHTANAFAMAGVLNQHYGLRVGVPFYACGVLVAGGRMEEDLHFLSDVVAGAAIGLVVGRSVSRTDAGRVSLLPSPTLGGVVLTLALGD